MGNISSYVSQSFPPKSKFQVEDIPDLSGKIIIVTGGNGGIGYETVKEIMKALLHKNAKVYMASRSRERAETAIEKLKDETGKKAIFLELDLSNFDSIRRATDEFNTKESILHVLFNNGGVMNTPIDQLTVDGIDLQFGTNVVGHYLFTKRLLPLLIAGAQSSPENAHIIHTASSAILFTDTIDLDAMKDPEKLRKLGSGKMYMQSKLANVVLSNEFARRYGDQGVLSNSVNPGNLKTDLQRHTTPIFMMLFGWMFSPAPFGALTGLYAGVSADGATLNGKYLIPWARMGTMHPAAENSELGERLWNWLEAEAKD